MGRQMGLMWPVEVLISHTPDIISIVYSLLNSTSFDNFINAISFNFLWKSKCSCMKILSTPISSSGGAVLQRPFKNCLSGLELILCSPKRTYNLKYHLTLVFQFIYGVYTIVIWYICYMYAILTVSLYRHNAQRSVRSLLIGRGREREISYEDHSDNHISGVLHTFVYKSAAAWKATTGISVKYNKSQPGSWT